MYYHTTDSEGKENAEGGDESPSSPCSPRDDSSPTGDEEENLEDTEASTEAKPINEDWDSGSWNLEKCLNARSGT